MKKLFTLVIALVFAMNSYAQELGEFNTNFGTDGTFVFDPSKAHDFMEKILYYICIQKKEKKWLIAIQRYLM